MSFVSFEFLFLFLAVYFSLALFKNQLIRKLIILIASGLFYAFWDWHFLLLLIFISVVDYSISQLLQISQNELHRKILLSISIILNLGILGYFKYYNFFIDNLNDIGIAGFHLETFKIILPIGISFFIFETISYIFDIYRRDAKPADTLLDYLIFISFFPRLVAGPIMRASHFLPQLKKGVTLNVANLYAGAQLFAQGLIKKIIIADRLAIGVDIIFKNPERFDFLSIWLIVFAYSIQIYFDFSGYSDMALGIARIIGFELPVNFNLPYVAQSLTEFWQRWHISLSTWLRDYLYIPLGGNRKGIIRTNLNLFITMLLGGLWHGASWNFVIWGGLHGFYLLFERLFEKNNFIGDIQKNTPFWLRSFLVYCIVSITWVFFRSSSNEITIEILSKMFLLIGGGVQWFYLPALVFVPVIFVGGLLLSSGKYKLPNLTLDKPYAIPLLLMEFFWVYLFAPVNVNPFIYFQF